MVVDVCRSQYEKYDKIIFPDRPRFCDRPDSSTMMANAAKYLYDRYTKLRFLDDNLASRPVMTMEQFLFSDRTAFVWDVGQIVSPNRKIRWWTEAKPEERAREREYLWSYGTVTKYCQWGSGLLLDTDIGQVAVDEWKCAVADVPPAVVAMLRRQMGERCPLKEAKCQS